MSQSTRRLVSLSLEGMLNKKYAKPVNNIAQNTDRCVRYINYLMATKLKIDILPGKRFGVDVAEVEKQLLKDNLGLLVPLLRKPALDECSAQTFYLYQHWLQGRMKNYVPSNPLVSVLQKIDIDFLVEYFKESKRGYFELSHCNIRPPKHWSSNTFQNVLFEVTPESIIISMQFEKDLAPTSFFIPLDRGQNLSEVLSKLTYKELVKESGSILHKEIPITEDDLDGLRLILNLIIYVTNPNEDFVEQFNEFSPNNRIAQIEEQKYTTKKYIMLGNDVEFLRLQKTEETNVKAFWRWQPVGEGRQQRRLTFVRPHTRTYTKHIGTL